MPVFRRGNTSILFVHVPKTGGTTIEKMFSESGYRTLYHDSKVGRRSPNWLRRCSPQHMHAAMLQQQFRLDRFDLTFMMVRDPLARFRSEYAMRNLKDLKTDAASVERWASRVLADYRKNDFVHDNHLRPQSEFYLPGCHVYQLEQGMDHIVNDLNLLLDLGLGPDIPQAMDRKLATGVASGEVELSPRLEKRLRRFYKSDFSAFGY